MQNSLSQPLEPGTVSFAATHAQNATHPASRRWIAVCLFLCAYIFSYLDRQVLSLLIGPVRATFHVSDTQFGLLNGLAFALFYATLGLPISALSDRAPRQMVIAGGIAVWSLATIACGLAQSFPELFAARVCVGAGEAVLLPAVYSYIADLFPPRKLGRALAVFSMGSFFGTGIAFLLGGWAISVASRLGDTRALGLVLHPWQLCFCIIGLPGLLLALVILGSVREVPHRTMPRTGHAVPSLKQVLGMIAERRGVFAPHLLGFSLLAMSVFGVLSWSPAFLARHFHLAPREVGLLLGALVGVFGSAGIAASGVLIDALAARGHRDAPFKAAYLGATGSFLPIVLFPAAGSVTQISALIAIAVFFTAFALPTSVTIMQIASPAAMRSRVSAIFLFCNSLAGLALGSFLIGVLNDHLFRGPAGVGASLAVVAGTATALGVLVLSRGAPAFRRIAAD